MIEKGRVNKNTEEKAVQSIKSPKPAKSKNQKLVNKQKARKGEKNNVFLKSNSAIRKMRWSDQQPVLRMTLALQCACSGS